MRSSQQIRLVPANKAHIRSRVTPEDRIRQARTLQYHLQRGLFSQSITGFAQPPGSLNSAPTARFGAQLKPQNTKTTKVKTRNEVNLTSDKYATRRPTCQKPHVTINSCARASYNSPGLRGSGARKQGTNRIFSMNWNALEEDFGRQSDAGHILLHLALGMFALLPDAFTIKRSF